MSTFVDVIPLAETFYHTRDNCNTLFGRCEPPLTPIRTYPWCSPSKTIHYIVRFETEEDASRAISLKNPEWKITTISGDMEDVVNALLVTGDSIHAPPTVIVPSTKSASGKRPVESGNNSPKPKKRRYPKHISYNLVELRSQVRDLSQENAQLKRQIRNLSTANPSDESPRILELKEMLAKEAAQRKMAEAELQTMHRKIDDAMPQSMLRARAELEAVVAKALAQRRAQAQEVTGICLT